MLVSNIIIFCAIAFFSFIFFLFKWMEVRKGKKNPFSFVRKFDRKVEKVLPKIESFKLPDLRYFVGVALSITKNLYYFLSVSMVIFKNMKKEIIELSKNKNKIRSKTPSSVLLKTIIDTKEGKEKK